MKVTPLFNLIEYSSDVFTNKTKVLYTSYTYKKSRITPPEAMNNGAAQKWLKKY